MIDARTKLVCCSGASNFLGTRTPLSAIRAIAAWRGMGDLKRSGLRVAANDPYRRRGYRCDVVDDDGR